MIKERRQHIRKHLEDPDDEKAHDDPLADFLGQGGFYDLAEAKAQDSDDQGDHDRRPDHEALAECAFFNHVLDPIVLP